MLEHVGTDSLRKKEIGREDVGACWEGGEDVGAYWVMCVV